MNDAMGSVVTVLLAIIGVAVIAVLVSRNAQTSDVLRAGGGAVSGILGSALSPITSGSNFGINLGGAGFAGGPAAG